MKKLVLIIAFLSLGVTFAQNNKAEAKVLSDFQTAYNTSNYEAIYNMYSEEKQANYPIERVKAFYERVHNTKGDITALTFTRTDKNFTVYKAVFTKTIAEVIIKLDSKGKAEELSIRNTVMVKQ